MNPEEKAKQIYECGYVNGSKWWVEGGKDIDREELEKSWEYVKENNPELVKP